MATFTPDELNLAVEIHQLVKRLNSLMREAEGLGLDVALRLEEQEETFEPGTIQHLHPGCRPDLPLVLSAPRLKVLVFKAILVEAPGAGEGEPPDAMLPHGWMG